MMFLAAGMMKPETSPTMINWFFFGHMLCYYPTLALTNTIAMKNVENSEKQFPLIRVFGTIGWIVAGLSLSFFLWDKKVEMFYLAGGAALLLGLISFALPSTPPTATGKAGIKDVLGLDALVMLKDRSYLVFLLSSDAHLHSSGILLPNHQPSRGDDGASDWPNNELRTDV